MASGSSADPDTFKTQSADDTFIFSAQTTISASHENSATANIYTPLIVSTKPLNVQSSIANSSSKSFSSANGTHNEKVTPNSAVLKKHVNKLPIEHRTANPRGYRSSVRPFFCCGSELSLVSLVDGLDLKDKKVSSIECNSSSEDDDSTPSSDVSRKSSSLSEHSATCNGENRHTVVRRKKKDKHSVKKKFWSLHFRGGWNPRWRVSQPRVASHKCELTLHSRSGCAGTYQPRNSPGLGHRSTRTRPLSGTSQFIDLTRIHDLDRLHPVDDIDSIRMRERAQEMAAGVDIVPNLLTHTYRPHLAISGSSHDVLRRQSYHGSMNSDSALPSPDSPIEDYSLLMNNAIWQWQRSRSNATIDGGSADSQRIHTQVDFIHCLVPDLVRILGCPFYWGVMDRYEAERLLDNKPEGTFLLRDSAQEDFLFSVSFRRYNRSLHARVELWNHRFSFDAHDPAVFSAPSVCELMEHYKDPCCCMFFEPMLTRPLSRNFPFSLQHICRAVICDRLVYDQIHSLPLPNSLKQFLQVYHYKQKVRVRHFDGPEMAYTDTNLSI